MPAYNAPPFNLLTPFKYILNNPFEFMVSIYVNRVQALIFELLNRFHREGFHELSPVSFQALLRDLLSIMNKFLIQIIPVTCISFP